MVDRMRTLGLCSLASRRQILLGLAALLAAAAAAEPAHAALVEGTITGTVTFVSAGAPAGIAVDDPITYVFRYDTDAAPVNVIGEDFFYATGSFSLTIGAYVWQAIDPSIFVRDGASQDAIQIQKSTATGPYESFPGLVGLGNVSMGLADNTAPFTMFSSGALPATIDLADVTGSSGVVLSDSGNEYVFNFSIDTLAIVPVPQQVPGLPVPVLGLVAVLLTGVGARTLGRTAQSPRP